jgi:mRNA interferase MazF
VTTSPDVPERGDLVRLACDPQTGHEKAGRRPAVVLSPSEYNGKVGLAIFCPITSRTKGYPFEVALPEGSPFHGVVLADQLESLDWRARRAERVGTLTDRLVSEILGKVALLLGV